MKNFTFSLILLISLTAYGQDNGTAVVNAHIVQTIQIEDGTALNFGSISAAGGGNVRVNTAGTRTFSNPDMKISTNITAPSAALFKVTAEDGIAYNIHIPSTTLYHAANTDNMTVSFTHEVAGVTDGNATGSGVAQDLKVGGLLAVAPTQTAGEYTGTVTVTVAYQ